jgi:hypothetical protein
MILLLISTKGWRILDSPSVYPRIGVPWRARRQHPGRVFRRDVHLGLILEAPNIDAHPSLPFYLNLIALLLRMCGGAYGDHRGFGFLLPS